MKLEMDIDTEKFKYSLVGDGYIKPEVEEMSEDELIEILIDRIECQIERSYYKGLRIGLY